MIKIAFVFLFAALPAAAQNVSLRPDFPDPEPSPYDTLLVDPPRRQESDTLISWAPEREIINLQEVIATIAWPEAACDTIGTVKLVYRVLFGEHGKYLKHKVVRGGDPLLHQVADPCVEKLQAELLLSNGKPCKGWWVNVVFEVHYH